MLDALLAKDAHALETARRWTIAGGHSQFLGEFGANESAEGIRTRPHAAVRATGWSFVCRDSLIDLGAAAMP